MNKHALMYYLIHEKERFNIFKTRGAAERFRYDKTRLFECIKGLQIRRIVMLNRMQHYIKNTKMNVTDYIKCHPN